MSLLNFSFIMVYITYKILVVLIKNHLNYLKDNIFEWFFNYFYLFKKKNFFSWNIVMKSLEEEENIMKDIRILFRLKKEKNYTAVKDIRNLFR